MVGPRRRLLRGLLALLLLPWWWYSVGAATPADGGLWIEPARTAIRWGKPLEVSIYLADPQPDLEQLDLSPWREYFAIDGVDLEWVEHPRWPDREVQRLDLQLHALGTGDVTLPPLVLSDAVSRPFRVTVKPPRAGGKDLSPVLRFATNQPRERQQILVRLSLSTPEPFALMRSEQEPSFPGFEVRPLPATRKRTADGVELELGWALFPLVAGNYRLQFPAMEYRIGGLAKYRWHLPPRRLTVRALPSYLPPTLAVGPLELHSRLRPADVLRPGQLAWWTLKLSGPMPATWLPPLPALGEKNGPTRLLQGREETTTKVDGSGVHGSRWVEIPVKPLSSGALQLPEVSVAWFDPVTGRLQRTTAVPPRRWVVAPWWIALAALIGIAALVALLVFVSRRVARYIRWHRAHRAALARLAAATDAYGLRRALNEFAAAQGWPANLALRDWLNAWRAHYRTPPGLDELVARLCAACYGTRQGADAEQPRYHEIQGQALTLLRKPVRHRTRYWRPG